MINIARIPDDVQVVTDSEMLCDQSTGINTENWAQKKAADNDASVRFELCDNKLNVYLTAKTAHPKFVLLRWNYVTEEPTRVAGDAWERAYVDLGWRPLNGERFMPWYFLAANDKGETAGCGVMVQPNSFVSFEYDSFGVSGWFDVRCGGNGVHLDGRELLIGTVVCEQYSGISSFEAAIRFCKVMCPNPLLPKEPVYGGNNWYYAYGNSSGKEIRQDAALIASLTEGNEVRPYMVIDDGWEPNVCAGPWIPNDRHVDMAAIAADFKKIDVKPGIWVRLLEDNDMAEQHPDWLIERSGKKTSHLDPSHPAVKAYVKETVSRMREWGYMLLKHDYSTADMFGAFGFGLNGMISNETDWSFYDKSRTGAEIVLDFYRAIREAAGDMVVLGCNTISHLCAGLVEANRIGDDTSGKYWNRTRTLGVNTLAFRLPQNNTFYAVDADCVGILDKNIPWELNVQWMDLLAKSGSPLFISCQNGALSPEQAEQVKEYFRLSSKQTDVAVPLDWEYNNIPHIWSINGETVKYNWSMGTYPVLLRTNYQPM